MADTTLTGTTSRASRRAGRASEDGGGPEAESWAKFRWQRWAACRDRPTGLFFSTGPPTLARIDEERAKSVCSACSVRARCLAFALEHDEGFGVWGGLNANERLALVLAEKKGLKSEEQAGASADRTTGERAGS